MADLVISAREWVRSGEGRPYMEGTLLADGSLAEDVAARRKWLTAEANMRGYKSIDDLAVRNYPLFEKLAKLWREKNPADALLSRSRYHPKVSPQSSLDADIANASKALEQAIADMKSGARHDTVVTIGRLPHVLNMLGHHTQDLEIHKNIIYKLFVDIEKHAGDFANVTAEQFVRAIYQPAMVMNAKSGNEVEIVTDLTGKDGAVVVPVILGDIKEKGAASMKSAYRRRVSNGASKPGADTILRRIGDAGRLVYVDLAKSRPALTGVANEEASAKAGFVAGGRNVAINTGDRGDLPTQATTTDKLNIASSYAQVNGNFVRWQVVGETLRNKISRKQVKTDMGLLKWIGNNYKPESSPQGWRDVPSFSRSSQTANQSAAERAEEITQAPAATWRPVDAVVRTLTTTFHIDRLTSPKPPSPKR